MNPRRGFHATWNEEDGTRFRCELCPFDTPRPDVMQTHLVGEHPSGEANPTTFSAGFDIARMLKNPSFREFVLSAGWREPERMIGAYPLTPVEEIVKLLQANPDKLPLWLFALDDKAPHGVRLLRIDSPVVE